MRHFFLSLTIVSRYVLSIFADIAVNQFLSRLDFFSPCGRVEDLFGPDHVSADPVVQSVVVDVSDELLAFFLVFAAIPHVSGTLGVEAGLA